MTKETKTDRKIILALVNSTDIALTVYENDRQTKRNRGRNKS